jgi:hypothetical protein
MDANCLPFVETPVGGQPSQSVCNVRVYLPLTPKMMVAENLFCATATSTFKNSRVLYPQHFHEFAGRVPDEVQKRACWPLVGDTSDT